MKGKEMRKATRITISTFGALVGLVGVEHGLGEALQGNVAPTGVMILSWPDSAFFHILSGEPALTILPNLLVTGVLAIAFSLLYAAWAIWFVGRKNGGRVLMALSLVMFLAGGGIFPPVLGFIIGAAATRIHAPLDRRNSRIPPSLRDALAKSWPWLLGAGVVSWLGMLPGVPVLSYFWGVENEGLIFGLLLCMFGFLFLSGAAAYAYDLRGEEVSPGGGIVSEPA
jgi:hypothetical protein